MALQYGVLRGRVDVFKREDDLSTPHLQIRVVDDHQQAWRVATNVLSGDQSRVVFHRVDPLQSHPIGAALTEIAPGFTFSLRWPIASTALDYFRAPLFDWPTGVAVPSTGPGADDDLQDVLTTYLRQLHDQNGELFAFGAKFPEPGQSPNPRPIDHEFNTIQGIHDIHMNQGNPNPGPFAKDNGVFQDGGLIIAFPSRLVGLFLRFQTQWLPTNNATGHRLPNAQPIPAGGGVPEGGPDVGDPPVYIERALVNPVGDDPGREVVVIANVTTASVDLTGWTLVDKSNKVDALHGVLAPGASHSFVLSGRGAQLATRGGVSP